MITEKRALWKQAFGDSDAYLDLFFREAYAPQRCHTLLHEGRLASALYWFDCSAGQQKLAYIYAVATEQALQGRGFCRTLLGQTHERLAAEGYDGAVLVPGSEALFALYEKLGYRTCCCVRRFACDAGAPLALRRLDAAQYAALRRTMLPPGGVVQEGPMLTLLSAQAQLYAGDGVLAACCAENGTLHIHELLGDASAAAGIAATLGCTGALVRTPCRPDDPDAAPFAMFHPLASTTPPTYFGLPLD